MKAARPEHRAAPRRALPSRLALMAAIALPLLQACAVTADGYGGDVGYVGGFYEPYGYEYGGWGPDYRVGPPRGGMERPRFRAGRAAAAAIARNPPSGVSGSFHGILCKQSVRPRLARGPVCDSVHNDLAEPTIL